MNTLSQAGSCHIATRWLNVRAALCAGLVVFSALAILPSARAVDVLTDMNDNNRTGRNPSETILNTGNVSQTTFGKVWAYSVNGSTYAQPLYASGISIAGGTHNVVFIETMDDDAYAFDADSNTQLWHVSFIGGNITAVPIANITGNNALNIVGNVGIESTPYIDKSTGTIYMLARTLNTSTTTYIQTLHALDISTGAEKFGGPVVVTTSGFDAKMENQRMGLAMANGNIIISWTSHEDKTPYHGWMMAYNATTLAQVGVFNDTATGTQGGIWQQGRAPAVDSSGNVYVITGNGTWDGSKNFGESFLKLSSTLSVLDWFTPDNFAALNSADDDLGSGGAMLIPGTTIVMGGGKQGTVYLCNTNSMGHEQTGNGQIIQHFTFGSGQLRGGQVYYVSPVRGRVVYDMASGDHLKEYTFNGSTFATTAVAQSTATSPGLPGGFVSISDNNGAAGSGIVWATIGSANNDHGNTAGLIRAWDADNIGGTELWDSNQNATRDALGTFVKDAHPTIANGRVYVGSYSNRVDVYALLGPLPVGAPVFSPGAGTYTVAQTVSISSSTSGALFRYTTDGVTIPTETVGTAYSGPVSISSTTTLMAIAYKSGMTDSNVVSAVYTINTTLPAAAPVFSPVGGTYTAAQNVAITSATSNATINYTTDGSTPTETHGTAYPGAPINISGTTVLRAIAFATGFSDSPVTSDTYTISIPQVAPPVFSPASGAPPLSVTITTATTGATINYTTDGSTPSETNGTAYSPGTAIAISSSPTTLQAIAFETGFTDSTITSATYSSTPLTFNFEAASMSPVGTGATVSTSSDSNVTGGLLEFLNSTAAGQSMTLTTPSIPAGTYQVQFRYKTNTSRGQHTVTIDGTPVGGTIDQYATTSTYPTATLGTVTFASAGTHTIVLTVTGKDTAATHFYITADKFTFTGQSTQVAAPTFNPGGGTFPLIAVNVTITSATTGANIRYTTDGSTPTETNGTLYSGSTVSIGGHTVLQAIAYKSGMADSTVTSATYDFEESIPPVFTPGGGTYSSAQMVTISDSNSGATIRYTTDGSTPSETHGTVYTPGSPVSIASTTTLEAIAYETGLPDTPITSATYTIGMPPTFNFEAESLSYTPNGATASVQTDTKSSGGKWVELAGNSIGDYIDYTVPNVPAGTYQLTMEWKGNTTRGILQLSVDGTNLGATLDQYSASQSYPTTTFGTVTFATAGNHTIRLTVTGKNSSSSSYQLSADKFTFVGQ